MLVKKEQPIKAELPIEVTPLGISMLVKEEQPLKASPPIEVTLNSISSIVTVDGIVIAVGFSGAVSNLTSAPSCKGSAVNLRLYPSYSSTILSP